MQILSPSNYLSPEGNGSTPRARHGSDTLSRSYIDRLGTQHRSHDVHDWSSQSPVNQIGSTLNPADPLRESPSQKSGDTSTFETSMSGSRHHPQTPQQEMANQSANIGLDWLPQSTMGHTDFHDPFQMWLFPSLGDLDQSPDFLETYNTGATPNFTAQESKPAVEERHQEPQNGTTSINTVPRERFARVQRCWAPRPHRLHRMMPNLWREITTSSEDNLFAIDSNLASHSRSGTSWGLDAACRFRLKESFRTPAPSTVHTPRMSAIDPHLSSNASDIGDFPPAEILDIALGLFFRHFHPTLPFIHVPDFCVKSTPPPLLFAVCLIGLSILGTTGATRFVSRMFSPLLERVTQELASCTSGTAGSVQQLTCFATALLTLNLAAMTGDKDSLAQSQMLYVSLMAMVQQNGLFSATDGQDLDSILSENNESEHQWKAWSRVESAKRLILGLLTLDSWYSNLLFRSPLVRSEGVALYAPCGELLFQAKSATQWRSLLRSGKKQTAPIFEIEDLHTSRLDVGLNLGNLGCSTMLALLQIQVLESYHRLMPTDEQTVGSLIPWQIYTNDMRARSMISAVLASEGLCGPSMRKPDTNCIVLWHSLCIMLLADFRMFELAAGRHGAGPAAGALENISQWSRTMAARRACVHAAQTFRIMSERKVSDNVTIHSVTALFSAALILGLYQFMAPPSTNHSNRTIVELVEADVDWANDISDVGFTQDALDRHPPQSDSSSLPRYDTELSVIHHFIRYGGTVSLGGVTQQGGYESARRVLLDFANLMDGISGRKLRTFTQVLHIMSDDLMNVDNAL